MDYLWSPWRYQYVTKAAPLVGCVFCVAWPEKEDKQHYIVHRGEHNFVMLNLYPYSTGHLLIAPYEHVGTLEAAPEPVTREMMQLVRLAEAHLQAVYRPQGLNLGMNIGEAAGAGVPGHIHMHVLPRWAGDTNFMTTVSETRVLPEGLEVTWEKLKAAWGKR